MSREDKIDAVNEQLRKLNNQMSTLASLIQESTTQFDKIKQFGIHQTSFFMSAHEVFQNINEERESYKNV